MTPEAAAVERALLALAPDDRAAVVRRALVSLDDETDDEIDASWREEIRRRVEAVERGDVALVSAEESEARISELLARLSR